MNDIDRYTRWTRGTVKYEPKSEAEYLMNGFIGEVGELYGAIAKFHRGDFSYKELQKRLNSELGDIAWFWARLCDYFEMSPSNVLENNIEKLEGRLSEGTIKGDGDGISGRT